MEKILVTGGAGFIGSHVVVSLAEKGYEPVIVDNFSNSKESVLDGLEKILGKMVKFYRVDCRDYCDLKKVFEKEREIAGVIHFVAYKAVGESVKKPLEYYENNIGSLISLMKCMKEFDVGNLVFSSSCTVYGNPDKLPISEGAPIKKAFCPYGNTKQICEEVIMDCLKSGDLKKGVLLRYFNPVGNHESAFIGELPLGSPANLIPVITRVAVGAKESFTVYGEDYDTEDGTCVRDYIHVVDLAEAHVKSLEFMKEFNGSLEVFNIGTGKGKSVREIIDLFEKVSGKKLSYEIGPRREGDVSAIYADSRKAESVLKWKAELSIEDALRSAWKWQQRIREF